MPEENPRYTERPTEERLRELWKGSPADPEWKERMIREKQTPLEKNSPGYTVGHGYTPVGASVDARYVADTIVAELRIVSAKQVSADARHIVKHLWIIFVLLPVILGILWEVIK